MKIGNKISNILREFSLSLSIFTLIIGIILFFFSITHYFLKDIEPEFIASIDEWNFYLIILGFIFLITGIWYLYSYLKNRMFIIREIDTNKRSEFMRLHNDLKNAARQMPSKYQKMIKEKEEQLNLK